MISTLLYEDSLTHKLYGKSRLPIFIMEKFMKRDYPLHHHNFAELSLVIDGTGVEILNGKPHRFKRGTVSFLLPHHIHEVQLHQPIVHKYNCMFDIQLLLTNRSSDILVNFLLKTGTILPSHYDLDEEQTAFMEQIFKSMEVEYNSEKFGKDAVLHSKLLEAFVFLFRTIHPEEANISLSTDSQQNVLDLLYYLHLHFHNDLTLHGLAKQFNWNASYISRLFKQHVGQSFIDYLHFLRVERAASLLASTSMSILDIALEVGFNSSQTLSRVFKKFKGVSPKEFREAHLNTVSKMR